jgi:hypothetical protein
MKKRPGLSFAFTVHLVVPLAVLNLPVFPTRYSTFAMPAWLFAVPFTVSLGAVVTIRFGPDSS